MKRTLKQERETIAAYKDSIAYYDGSISRAEMYDMLHYRFQFGEAESRVIISALVLSGAKFKD